MAKKGARKGTKKPKKPSGSTFRDRRGVDGVVDDATGTKRDAGNFWKVS